MQNTYVARISKDLEASRETLMLAIADREFVQSVSRAAEAVTAALRDGRKVLFAGNGGSAADAQHLATELLVRFYVDRAALPAMALTTDGTALTAIGNDLGFEQVFSRQILALGDSGDVFVAMSTSGRSPNILAGCTAARERGMAVIGFTGSKGDSMQELCDILLRVPSDKTPLIQEVHLAAGHIICAIVEEELSGAVS